ncbi:RING-H2 finger protein ATL20-like [Macadamia integrifolia]|uniref:RING-H2 finger protein ATL20-like n=1 Tax=Macadamia integrifolia TaxID=60698 RepID=UPI001C52BA32|nr:RING-H2 finger protein ATL20-like [Macadamia integrifolia]
MGSSVLFLCFFLFIFLFHLSSYKVVTGQNICQSSTCGDSTSPEIRFPFRIKMQQEKTCGYPGFDLKCEYQNQSRTILELPSSGRFWLQEINYTKQEISIVDPENCIWRKFLTLNLSSSVFSGAYYDNYTILRCSTNLTMPLPLSMKSIDCMSNSSYEIRATLATVMETEFWMSLTGCERIATVAVPVPWSGYYDENGDRSFSREDLRLEWDEPNCVDCETKGGRCGRLKSSNVSGIEFGCFDIPPTANGKTGLPRSVSYAVTIGIGIPALLCGIGIACYVGGKVKRFSRRNSHITQAGSSSTFNPQPAVIAIALDESTIESYPKVVLGESCRLPGHNDSPCPICLAEYQPKETLRTIPQCQHCFHAACIDEWLRTNATCPLCRTSPALL